MNEVVGKDRFVKVMYGLNEPLIVLAGQVAGEAEQDLLKAGVLKSLRYFWDEYVPIQDETNEFSIYIIREILTMIERMKEGIRILEWMVRDKVNDSGGFIDIDLIIQLGDSASSRALEMLDEIDVRP